MVRPISLRIRSAVALREARATIRRLDETDRLRRVARVSALKALVVTRAALNAVEAAGATRLDARGWQRRRAFIEDELQRLVDGK